MLSGNLSDDEMLPPTSSSTQRKSTKASNSSTANELIKAYQVTAYKYIEAKYENRGKIGMALLGSKSAGNFNILLYGKSNAALAQASLNKDFEVTSGRDLYISFYDIKSENWSILFDSFDIYIDFINRVTILKLVSSKQDFIYMDIRAGEGTLIHDSDLCEAEIIMNGVKNLDIVSILYSSESQESNKIIRLKIGANKLLPALDKGISGMMKGGQRIIAISSQSSLLKGGSIKVPNDVGVLINIKVVRIKTKTEKPTANNEAGDSELSLPNLNFNKDTEYDGGDQSKKAELIKRIKLVGQPLVKFNVSEENEYSMPNNTEPINYVQSNNYVSRPSHVSNAPIYENTTFSNQVMPLHSTNSIMATMQQLYQPIQSSIPTVSSDLVFTENRQHNTEMRIAISKLQDKIDRIADKLDNNSLIQRQPTGRHMDAENVFENVKRIIDENELLKKECSLKSDTIDSQNKKINELLNKSQQYLEESRNVLDRSSAAFSNNDSENQRKILKLEEDKLDLIRNLSRKTSELSNLEMKVESLTGDSQGYRNKSLELNEQLDKLTTEMGDLKLKHRSLLTEVDRLKEDRLNVMGTNEDLIDYKRRALDNEKKLQSNIDALKNSVREANDSVEQVRRVCDNDISEIRRQHNVEVEQLRERLKEESRMRTSKSSNLELEIETINRQWESKFSELKESEVVKLSKLNERNSQLMTENSGLNREIFNLKDELSVVNNSHLVKVEELMSNNRLLKRHLEDAQSRIIDVDRLRTDNEKYEREISRLTKLVEEMSHFREDLKAAVDRKRELESMVKTLTEELNVKPTNENRVEEKSPDVEGQIKGIMNDIFKNIKLEFELDKSYSGREVNVKCMIIIRDSTVNLMKSMTDVADSSDEESSESESSDEESIVMDNKTDELVNKESDYKYISSTIQLDNSGDYAKQDEDEDNDNFVKYGTEEVVELEDHEEIVNDAQFSDIQEKEEIMESEYSKEIANDGNCSDIPEKGEMMESDGYDEYLTEINEEGEFNTTRDELVQNMNIVMTNATEEKCEFGKIEGTTNDSDDVSKVENKVDLSQSMPDDQTSIKDTEMTENVSSEAEPKSVSEVGTKSSSVVTENHDTIANDCKVKENNPMLSSDEDDDVSGFFEQLNQKKKSNIEQTKPVSSELDDDLSWLHS